MPANISVAALSRPVSDDRACRRNVIGATLVLWAYYGTAVFFEMVRAGWVACF